MRAKQHIAILLIVAFSAYLGHSIVPHHHHEGVLQHTEEANCTHAHDHDPPMADHHEHECETPVHCHAFNNLIFNKHQGIKIHKPERAVLAFLFPGIPSISTTRDISGNDAFKYFDPRPPEPVPSGTRSLRGPPRRA